MKKTIVRVLALALVLILALGIIPLAAFAIEPDLIVVHTGYYDVDEPTYYDYFHNWNNLGMEEYQPGSTIKYSDYDKTTQIGDKLYDFAGFEKPDWESVLEGYEKDNILPFYKGDIEIPKDLANSDFLEEWMSCIIYASYTPHQHALSYWYSDTTTHWRECLVCKKFANQGFWEQFMYQNWHSDGDENRICDICGADIPYHEVKVIDSEGGKITVNFEEAPYRRKITATVEVESGYQLEKLHFTKVRDDGSTQEITRYQKNGEFWTLMPTYDLEITAEYTKK